jgi:peptide deformylase
MVGYSLQRAGAAALRAAARPVRHDDTLAPLLAAMEKLVLKEKAQGLSAPQMGAKLRLFMLARDGEDDGLVVLNPRILRRSRACHVDWEACLSVPEYAALVSRARRVAVEFETLDGETMTQTLTGNRARVFQHEIDHLDGVLYTSRMIPGSFTHTSVLRDPLQRSTIERQWRAALAAEHETSDSSTEERAPAARRS